MQKSFRTNPPHALLIGLFIAWSAVVAVCYVFVTRIDSVTGDEVDRYLLEISNGVAATINSQIGNTFRTLKSVGLSYSMLKEEDNGLAVRHLQKQVALFGFKRITITDRQGRSVYSDGRSGSLRDISHIRKGFAGKNVFIRMRRSPVDGSDGVLYVSPIVGDREITGVITAWSELVHMQSVLHTSVFNGQGHFHILGPDGTTLLNPSCEDDPDSPTFFDLLSQATMHRGTLAEMRERMRQGGSGRVDFTFRGDARSVCYVPLRADGTYLVSVVPTQTALEQSSILLRESLIIVISIVTIFTALILLLYFRDKKSSRRLAGIAFVDPVTGGMTPNRFRLEALPKIAEAPPGAYSLVSVNIKQFKLVNDILGSKAGDRLLKQVHDCLKAHLTEDELICRDYADDFVLLATTRNRATSLWMVESIAARIDQSLIESDYNYKLRLCIGIYEIEDKTLPLISLIDRANLARKNVKTAVRGDLFECVFYSDLERQQMIKTKDIENKMEDALANEDFVVYLQPKIELENKKIVGAEALVRWRDMGTGLIPPGDFIPCFETNGFIIKLDLYVFEYICRTMRKWIDDGLHPVPVSVNLSRAHLLDPYFLESYVAIRDRYGIQNGLLEIELTESLIFEKYETLINVVNDLHTHGFVCSLDDFGSGYSSLNLLKGLHVDTLKLDGAFWMSPGADNQRERDIIAAVVDLARKLGMKTVSEGVETTAQLEFLRQINCDMVQGYVYSEPVPLDTFEKIAFGKEDDATDGSLPQPRP